MKKILLLLISFICAGAVYADNTEIQNADKNSKSVPVIDANANVTVNPAVTSNVETPIASEESPVVLSKDMKITSKAQHQNDPKFNYQIDVSYPQIQGNKLSTGAKQFNKTVENLVSNEVNEFKKSLIIDMPHMQTLPEALRKNSLKVDYDVDVIKPKNETLISVRLTFEGMQAGRAHPYHNNRVLNFDLNSGKVLVLNNLFKKHSKFLQLLAAYSKDALNKKLKQDSWMVAQGTKADDKNFKNWNLQADSLLITFDEYQVAPYVFGAQEVEVPYSELKKILSAKAPIADCAVDSNNCQVG